MKSIAKMYIKGSAFQDAKCTMSILENHMRASWQYNTCYYMGVQNHHNLYSPGPGLGGRGNEERTLVLHLWRLGLVLAAAGVY